MARIFITGSSDGLGLGAAQLLADQGHQVTLHARNEARADDARQALPQAEAVLLADVSSLDATKGLAAAANDCGPFDAVIHNVAVGDGMANETTAGGFNKMFAVNVLAPYLLTALVTPPKRLVYLSSGMHYDGTPDLTDPQWQHRAWDGMQAYSDSKLFDATLAFAAARLWPNVLSNAVDPGWVKTKMGGAGAPEDVATGSTTQAWLAVSHDAGAKTSGKYFYKQEPLVSHAATDDVKFQTDLLTLCAKLTGVPLPT